MSSPSVAKLVTEMERITSARFVVDVETQMLLDRSMVGNLQPIVVPPQRVWTVFEALLSERGFCLGFVSTEEPIMFTLTSTQPQAGRGGGGPRARALYVPIEDLPAWSAHPAFAITTTVTLDDVNIRDLSNSMRQMFTDPQSQQIIPVGNSNTLMITGFGPSVASLASTLQVINESERLRHEKEDKLSEELRLKVASRTGVTPRK